MAKICQKCSTENRDTSKFCSRCGNTLVEGVCTLQNETVLAGRYKVIRPVKSGGMGSVYEAIDEHFGDKCALKEMSPKFSSQKEQEYIRKRFEEEAKMLRKLHHTNMPRVVDYFVDHGVYYLVMDFIEGEDLETVLDKQGSPGLPEVNLIDWSCQILDVLSYLHSQKPPVIYRDLKPGNIMLRHSDGKVLLVDFGIARTMASETDASHTVIGTQGYAPPEQYKGQIEPASDIYALGATFHHLSTGMPPLVPFAFEPVRNFSPSLSRNFETVIMKALSLDVKDRFSCAEEMKLALIYNKIPSVLPSVTSQEKKVSPSAIVQEKKVPSSVIPQEKKVPVVEIRDYGQTPGISDDMILIPSGEVILGSKEQLGFLGSKWQVMPVYRVRLDDYYIDKYPVTFGQYEEFVNKTGYRSEGQWKKYYSAFYRNYPVVNVTWNDAGAYATWKGKRLPTQAEWEKAARGTDFRTYPWGQEWDRNKCNNLRMDRDDLLGRMMVMEQGKGTLPAGSFPEGLSFYGVMDMSGNVWEWCSDWYYKPEGFQINPKGPLSGTFKILCGGSWLLQDIYCFWCATRTKEKPASYNSQAGFRCVKNA